MGRRRGHGLDGAQSLPLLRQKTMALAHRSEPAASVVGREGDQGADHLGADLGAQGEPGGRREQAQTFRRRLGRPSTHRTLGDDQLEVDRDAVGSRHRPGPFCQICGVVRQPEEGAGWCTAVDEDPVPGVDRDQAGPQIEQVVARAPCASPDPPGESVRLGVAPEADEAPRLPDLRVDEVSPRAGVRQDRRCPPKGVRRLRQQTSLVEDGGLVHQADPGVLRRRVVRRRIHRPEGRRQVSTEKPGVAQIVLGHETHRGVAALAGSEVTAAREIADGCLDLAVLEREPATVQQGGHKIVIVVDPLQSRIELDPRPEQVAHAHEQ
ncbi:hypothetical protein [Isoptericola sp. QY 916]|uniref:hypothetical protein n=1 Tax=Isoptericola sp. QY 916 TaxID=2782570 RepID=UPI003D3016A2|nr:hypothetical protein [Isoptericola sp. QY 916]